MTERGEIPPVPEVEKCHCILSIEVKGMNYSNGFGETRCKHCKKHVRWGCGVPLTRPAS